MLTKLSVLVKSKVALAALGALVVGGGATAAVAAAHGHGVGLGLQALTGASAKTPGANHGHSPTHVEGLLTACSASAGTISVTNEQGQVYSFVVTSSTKFTGDIHSSGETNGDTSKSHPTGKPTSTPGASKANPNSSSYSLSDLCVLVNQVKVQTQADATTSGKTTTYTAEKITVEGPGTNPDATETPGSEATKTPGSETTKTPGAQASETPGAH